jgi:hypothetical protein
MLKKNENSEKSYSEKKTHEQGARRKKLILKDLRQIEGRG